MQLVVSPVNQTPANLEPRTNFPCAQITGSRDELDPEAHAPLASVTQLQHGASGYAAVVYEVEHSHLVQVEHHFELVGGDDLCRGVTGGIMGWLRPGREVRV